MTRELEFLQLKIPVAHNDLPDIIQAVSSQRRGSSIVPLAPVANHFITNNIHAFKLMHNGHREGLPMWTEVDDAVLWGQRSPFRDTVFFVQAEMMWVVELEENILSWYRPGLWIVVTDVAWIEIYFNSVR